MCENAMAAIQPAVWPPGESVQRFMRVLVRPTTEQNLRRPRGFWLAPILDRDEHKIRRSTHPHTAESNLNATDKIQSLREHRPPIELAVAIGVFENENAIFSFPLR